MATATLCRSPIDALAARSAGYTLLAHVFAYPDAERFADIREIANEYLAAEQQTPLTGLAHLAMATDVETVEPEYVALMSFSSSPDCPAFETAYFSSDAIQQTMRMADIAGFYRAFGVDTRSGGFRPDELSVELEFMAYLCQKEAYAVEHLGAPRVKQTAKAQRMFMGEHLGRWGAAFGRRVSSRATPGSFYHMAALALSAWISDDCVLLGTKPEEVSGEPSTDWRDPISHGPEFAAEPTLVPLNDIEVM